MRPNWTTIGPVAAGLVLALGHDFSIAVADGGTVRYSAQTAGRLVTVFTDPTPLRTGRVDVSVLIQEADSGRAISDLPITVQAEPIDGSQEQLTAPATAEAATNKLMRAAQLNLATAGRWRLAVEIEGINESPLEFEVEVAKGLPPWFEMSLWIAWPLAAICLFGVHQVLVRRRTRRIPRPA